MIIPRPLKRVLGKIIPFSQEDKIPTFNLGSGTADNTTYLRGDGTWAAVGGGSGGLLKGTASGVDTYTTTITGVASYTDGDAYLIRFTTGNTTGCSLNINSLGARTLYRNNDGVLIGGDIVDGAEMFCIYNSTLNGFQVIGTSPNTLISYVTNAESVTITKGQPVYAFGGTGDRLRVKLAYNTSDATSAQTVGLVMSSSIAANQKGFIIVSGLLDGLSILPTSTYADGDAIYLGATAGSITNVKPVAPNHMVYLGFVTTASNGSAGRMYVRVQNGYELQELHNVAITTPANGQVLQYESATSLWKNATPSSGALTVGTTAIASGTVGRILFQNGGNVLGQDSALFWDNTNKRLGVGATPASTVRLDVRAQGALSTDIALRVRNSADSANIATIQGDGSAAFGTYTNPNTRLTVTGTTFGSYISGNTGIYAQTNTTTGTLYAIDCLGRALSGANTSYGIRATSDTSGVGSINYGGRFSAANGTTNYAGYFDATGGTNNYALVTQRGFSGFNKTDPAAIVDIKAQGALSTDIAFRVRNSADNKNIIEVRGDGETRWNGLPAVGNYVAIKNYTSYDATIDLMGGNSVKAQISMDIASNLNINRGLNIWNPGIIGQSTSKINNIVKSGLAAYGAGYGFNWAFTSNASGVFTQSERALWLTSTKSMVLYNGSSITDTHSEKADSFEMYSSDIVAGNAAPHFRTEVGDVIKLYKETTAITASTLVSNLGMPLTDTDTFDGYTLKQVVKALRNLGLLA